MRIFPMSPVRLRPSKAAGFVLAAAVTVLCVTCVRSQAQSSPQHDASLDVRNAQGLTPLVAAASAGDMATVKSLLAKGADVDATAADGRTALIAATQGGKLEAVEALIAAGANLNLATRGGGTALNIAENTGQAQLAALLLQAGAQSTGKSVGDTVCVRPWGGEGFCGTVKSFTTRAVQIQITRILGCAGGCEAREECSAGKVVGGSNGAQSGDPIEVPSWCLTQTGVKP
jgi:hypothetical protein